MSDALSTFRVGLVQMCSGRTVAPNIEAAGKLIREAAAGGANYVQTPEMTNVLEMDRQRLPSALRHEADDPGVTQFRFLARELNIWLHIGSLALLGEAGKPVNRAFLISPEGRIAARYDKIHMFDIQLASGESYRESASYQPGDTAVFADLPWGRLGLTICYDMRFPALYRALAERGAIFLAAPSAFTKKTGEAHWHTLLRARAIENGAYVFAAAQGGTHESGRVTYGHSLIVDPWGEVLAEAGTEPGVILAQIDPARVASVRKSIPSLQHGRRFGIVEPHDGDRLSLVRGTA